MKPSDVLPDVSLILPPPFEWCRIPAGPVTLTAGGYVPEGGQTFDVPVFAIAKYPVTNAQFEVFVQAEDGYRDPVWWDYLQEAKAWRQENANPRDSAFGGVSDCPRTQVSWYEAVAFCRWLSVQIDPTPAPFPNSGRGERGSVLITLPTDQQWQRAAQGEDGRQYPWGNSADASRCNVRESGIGQTTSVTQYPNGASPYGILDMVGNVWEWCVTEYESGVADVTKNVSSGFSRVDRGGAFEDFQRHACNTYRGGSLPAARNLVLGFRIVCI